MKYLVSVFVVLMTVGAFAAIKGAPFQPEVDQRFNTIEGNVTTAQSNITALQAVDTTLTTQTADGLAAARVARATYDVAVDGGTVAAHPLGVTLPAKSIIKQAWFYTSTQFVDAGSGTVALHCEDANNIYTATDITGNTAGTIVAGAATGAAANMVKGIANACEITATVAGAEQSAGKLILYVEYVVHD